MDDIRAGFSGAKEFAVQTFELPSYIVPHRNKRSVIKFCYQYDLEPDDIGVMYDVKEDRVVFPVVHDGKIVDATGRAIGKRLPKWKRYGNSGLPYTYGCGNVAVVVEDCVSAAVVGYGSFVGVALLGTSLQESHKGYLAQFSTAIIALDPDALPKTLQMAKELRGHVNDVRVLRLKDDLKYRNPTDMENLYGIITD
jgi:DNA primase